MRLTSMLEFDRFLDFLKPLPSEWKSKWKCFFDFHLSKLGGKLVFLGNLSEKDATKLNVKDHFLQELIEIWADFN